jgi:hypothetical protein
MRDHLLDLVSHTFDLGTIDKVRIVGTDTGTSIFGIAEDNSIIVEGKTINPVPEFIGTFGMPNLSKLKILLNLQEYKEDAILSISRKDGGGPDQLNFANKAGDFKNSYRFMAAEVANDRIKPIKLKKEVTWNIEFEPSTAAILRLKMQATANSEENNFQVKVENGDLKFFFGDHSTHAGNFVFEPGVTGKLTRSWSWPVKAVIGILDLYGDKVMRISDEGAAQIVVNTGLAVYSYMLPAQSK